MRILGPCIPKINVLRYNNWIMSLRFSLLSGLAALLVPTHVFAQIIPCALPGLPCVGGGGAEGLNQYIMEKIVPLMEVGFIGVAVVMLFTYAATFVFWSTEESSVTEAKTAYIYAITGASIVGLADITVRSFAPSYVGANIVNIPLINSGIQNVILYFKLILATAVTSNIVIQAFRLITAQSQDQTEKARKRILTGFVGVAIMLMTDAIMRTVSPEYGAQSVGIAIELVGVANFLLVILGVLFVAAIVVAGMMLILSADESLKDKAKSVVKTSVISLIIVMTSFIIVNTFLSLRP